MKSKPVLQVTPARRVAFEVLALVGENKGHSDDLLHTRTASLSPEDRNLATALVLGTLRWQIALDARIAAFLQRPDQQLAAPVAIALRLGAFQLLHMDRIPAHAALSESVELAKWANHAYASGMVNAILRKLSTAPALGTPLYESTAAFATRLGHPLWLVERWVAAYGRTAAISICEADQHEPAEDHTFFVDAPSDLPRIDPGSRLVAELSAAAMPAQGSRIWDACAAPGGKTLCLAYRLPTAEILATDVSPRRLEQMQRRMERTSFAERIRCEVADASASQNAPGFDLILCDAPCSGTGTLARNPEIRHHLRAGDLARQADRQRALLQHALRQLAPGGRLVYSTCSLEPEENERVVDAVLRDAGVRLVPVEGLLDQLAAAKILQPEAAQSLASTAVRGGALRTLPGIHPCDGFFAAVFERSA
ncbi:MAG TPA: transcription antitermination factor NusB [Granulicella sp.]